MKNYLIHIFSDDDVTVHQKIRTDNPEELLKLRHTKGYHVEVLDSIKDHIKYESYGVVQTGWK